MKALLDKSDYMPMFLFIIPAIGYLIAGFSGGYVENDIWLNSQMGFFTVSGICFMLFVGGILGFIYAPHTLETPKKLIRTRLIDKIPNTDWEIIMEDDELNKLYRLKVLEELEEVQNSKHKDINEFVDLIQVCQAYARENGFSEDMIMEAMKIKTEQRGGFSDIALTKLNYHNPSNKIYYKK